MKNRVVCGSDTVLLWLGGSIGTLYRNTDCDYAGTVILETAKAASRDRVERPRHVFREGTFGAKPG